MYGVAFTSFEKVGPLILCVFGATVNIKEPTYQSLTPNFPTGVAPTDSLDISAAASPRGGGCGDVTRLSSYKEARKKKKRKKLFT